VSVSAHLLPLCRSNPNPAKGFGAGLPQEGGLPRLSRRDQSRLAVCYRGSHVEIVQTRVGGKKRESCGEEHGDVTRRHRLYLRSGWSQSGDTHWFMEPFLI